MSWSCLLALLLALLFRKLEWPFAQPLWIIATVLLFADGVRTVRKYPTRLRPVVLLLLVPVLAGLYLRYGTGTEHGRAASAAGVLSLSATVLLLRSMSGSRITRVQTMNGGLVLLLLLTGSLVNDWEFYRLIRGKNLEELLLSRLPDDRMEDADRSILALCPKERCDSPASEQALRTAIALEAQRELDEAGENFDKALYLDPYNAAGYFRRGAYKLLRLELDNQTAESAIRDFSRSIRLDPSRAMCWFLRAQALAYLNRRDRACRDLGQAIGLEPALLEDARPLMQKCCPDSGHFIPGMPLHP
jgi:tetratricopeptide (TPR) repeat protein